MDPAESDDLFDAVNRAYGSASQFVQYLGILAGCARHTSPTRPVGWSEHAMTFAIAFVSWHDLSHLLTLEVMDAAQSVYPPGTPSIKLATFRPKETVIEIVAHELGVYFRNILYHDRECPLDPDLVAIHERAPKGNLARQLKWIQKATSKERLGIRKRLGIRHHRDACKVMSEEWERQDRSQIESQVSLFQCWKIDFDDLRTLLMREARAVLALVKRPDGRPRQSKVEVLWKEAQKIAVRQVKRNGGVMPSRNTLAGIAKCSRSTMTKAIQRSTYLKARLAETHSKAQPAGRTKSISKAHLEEVAAPNNHEELHRLIEEQDTDRLREERQRRAGVRKARRG